jgi:hypothetical protein
MKTMTTNPWNKLLVLTAAIALSACGGKGLDQLSNDTPAEGEADIGFAVGEEYGGLTEADEEPDFGDEELATADDLNDDGEDVDDTTADEGEADLADAVIPPKRVKILVAWGLLRGNPFEVEEPTDWSGTITAENAGLRIRRVVAFEGTDHIIRPRPDFSTVEMVSHTLPHVDGLLLEVILHPQLGTSLETPPALVFNTAAYQGTLDIRPNMARAGLEVIDDVGNAVAYHVIPNLQDLPDCKQGFIAGRWVKRGETDDGRSYGRLKGKVMDEDGHIVGKLRGVWGERATNGSQVFFAKVIGNDGQFKARLAGRYGDGHFRGRVVGKNRIRRGVVAGQYRNPVQLEGGVFRGRYNERCGELRNEGAPEAHDEEQVDGTDALDESNLPEDASTEDASTEDSN